MADVKISALPTASLATPDDLMVMVDSGSLTTQQISVGDFLQNVSGSDNSTIFAVKSDTYSDIFVVSGSNRVGIGGINPAHKFNVNGEMAVSGNLRVGAGGRIYVPEVALAPTPDSGFGQFYAKTDGLPYFKNDTGTEFNLSATGPGGGSPAGLTGYIQINSGSAFATGSNLFWNYDNDRMGIGTNSPDNQLTLSKDGATTGVRIRVHSNTITNEPFVGLHRTRGTEASRSGVLDGDYLGNITWVGRESGGSANGAVRLRVIADGDWTPSNIGAALTFETAGNGETAMSERMRIAGDGNVGIGALPASSVRLFVSGANNTLYVSSDGTAPGQAVTVVNEGSSSPTNGAGIYLASGDGASNASGDELGRVNFGGVNTAPSTFGIGARIRAVAGSLWSGVNSDTDLVFDLSDAGSTIPAEVMRLTGDGKVGIGTSAPEGKLHVYSDVNAGTSVYIENPNTGAGALAVLHVGQDISTGNGTGLQYLNSGFSTSGLQTANQAKLVAYPNATGGWLWQSLGSGPYIFTIGNATSVDTERFRISNSEVVVNENGETSVDFRVESNSNTHQLFVDSGNNSVGINTDTPTGLLTVAADNAGSTINNKVFSNTTTHAPQISLWHVGGTEGSPTATPDGSILGEWNYVGYSTAPNNGIRIRGIADGLWSASNEGAYLTFETIASGSTGTPVERMRLTSDGNVGIGTTAPSASLHVSGAAGDTELFRLENDTGAVFSVTGSDNAGAGYVVLPVTGGAPTEAKPDGAMIVDSTNNFIYVRVGGAWLSASLN